MKEREHGEMEIIMNGTGKMHPPVTLDKARGIWRTERALLANECRKMLCGRAQVICLWDPGWQKQRTNCQLISAGAACIEHQH